MYQQYFMRHQFEYSPTSSFKTHLISVSQLPQESFLSKTRTSHLQSLKQRINKLLDSDERKPLGSQKRHNSEPQPATETVEFGKKANGGNGQEPQAQERLSGKDSSLSNRVLHLYVANGSKTIELSLTGFSHSQAKKLVQRFKMQKLEIAGHRLA